MSEANNMEKNDKTSDLKIEENKCETIAIVKKKEKDFEFYGNFRDSDLYKEKSKDLQEFQNDKAHQWKIYAKDCDSEVWKLENNNNELEFTVGDVVKNKSRKLSIIGGIQRCYNKYYLFLMDKNHNMFRSLIQSLEKVGTANTNDATLAIQMYDNYEPKSEKIVHKTEHLKYKQNTNDTDEETSEKDVQEKSKKKADKKRKKKEKKDEKRKEKRKERSPDQKMTKNSNDEISPYHQIDYDQHFSQPSQNQYPPSIYYRNFQIEQLPPNNLQSPYHHVLYNQHFSHPSYQNQYPSSMDYQQTTFNHQENYFDRFPPYKNYLYNRMPFYNNTQFFSNSNNF